MLKPLHNIYYFYCVEMTDSIIQTGNKPLKYVANDWFYMKNGKNEICDNTEDVNCIENKSVVHNLQQSTNHLGASIEQYNDSKILYNRELLFTVNIVIGLVMICYYFYFNTSVISFSENVNNGIMSVKNAISSLGGPKIQANPIIASK